MIKQMPDTTEMAAAGFARGAKTYQQRARTALPILVRQAKAHQTMSYGELAHEMGIPNPRTLNYPLGSIGGALLDLGMSSGGRAGRTDTNPRECCHPCDVSLLDRHRSNRCPTLLRLAAAAAQEAAARRRVWRGGDSGVYGVAGQPALGGQDAGVDAAWRVHAEVRAGAAGDGRAGGHQQVRGVSGASQGSPEAQRHTNNGRELHFRSWCDRRKPIRQCLTVNSLTKWGFPTQGH